jgi:arylformamidase
LARIIDITIPLTPSLPVWPGSPGIRLIRTRNIGAANQANESKLECDVHVGTHVDAPLHYLDGGASVDALPLENLIGPALVVDLTGLDTITAKDLEYLELPAGVRRLLLRTKNSQHRALEQERFIENYTALTADAAEWIVDHHIALVGVDYLSVQVYGDNSLTHYIMLAAGVIIVEGLNLAEVQPGSYQLLCLPIPLVGSEGAPARVVLLDDFCHLSSPMLA